MKGELPHVGVGLGSDTDDADKSLHAAVSEIGRLEKLVIKAEQRLQTRYRQYRMAKSRLEFWRHGDPDPALERARRIWDRAADDRLRIIVRLASLYRLVGVERLADHFSDDVGLRFEPGLVTP